MYFLSTSQETENYHLIKDCLQRDNLSATNDFVDVPDGDVPIPKKKRKQSFQSVSVTSHAVFDEVGGCLNEQLDCANPNRSLYSIFQEQLVC